MSIAIGVSLVVSLTDDADNVRQASASRLRSEKAQLFYRASEWVFERVLATYTHALKWVLGTSRLR